jgi:hypothetical protein
MKKFQCMADMGCVKILDENDNILYDIDEDL